MHIQNSTLAGGVAMGTAAEFMISPYGALIVGFCCGIISTFGYIFVSVSLCVCFNFSLFIYFLVTEMKT